MALNLIPLLLLAFSVSIGNFFASVGIGLTSIKKNIRIKVLLLFGFFELIMPIIGLIIGANFSGLFVMVGRYIGAGLLFLLGAYNIVKSREKKEKSLDYVHSGNKRLMLIAFALSIDNLIVGFAFGSYALPILSVALFIAIISVSLSAIGLEIGRRFGKYIVRWEDATLGIILILVGLFILLS